MKSAEYGRSMVEMLGVLGIVGILSLGGIAGYSKAMAKLKTDRLIMQISEIVMNIRNIYIKERTMAGISEDILLSFGAIPRDMYDRIQSASATVLTHAAGGKLRIFASQASGSNQVGFEIYVSGLTRSVCVDLVTTNWGLDPASGFQCLYVGTGDEVTGALMEDVVVPGPSHPENGIYTVGMHEKALPLPVVDAMNACSCSSADCIIGLKYL